MYEEQLALFCIFLLNGDDNEKIRMGGAQVGLFGPPKRI